MSFYSMIKVTNGNIEFATTCFVIIPGKLCKKVMIERESSDMGIKSTGRVILLDLRYEDYTVM